MPILQPPPLSAEREQMLLITLAAIQFLHIVDFMIMMPLGPMLMEELGIGTREFAMLVSSYTFAAAVAGLLVALLVDRFERKRFLLTIFALFTLATLACGFAPDYPALLLARITAGAFGGVLGAVVHTMVGDLIPFERRGRASGKLMAAFSLSTVAGVPLSLYLANHFGWRFPFLFIAALSGIALAQAWHSLPLLHGHLAAAAERRHAFTAIFATLRDPNHLWAFGFASLVIAASFMVIPYITLGLIGNAGVAQDDIPLVYLCGGIATFFSARWIGHLSDLHGKVQTYRRVALASLLPLLAITHLGQLPLAAVLACTTLFFILVPGRMVPTMAIITSAARPELRGTFLSLNAAMLQLASGLASVIGGLIIVMDESGRLLNYTWIGYLSTGLTGIALWVAGRIRMEHAAAR